jgi:hypothetical protein
MGDTNVTSNLFYDLVSIQYHALKGQELYQRFTKDAQGNAEVARFFEEIRQQDIQRAERCHELLQTVQTGTGTGTGGTARAGGARGGQAEPYPTDQQATGGQTGTSGQTQMAGQRGGTTR